MLKKFCVFFLRMTFAVSGSKFLAAFLATHDRAATRGLVFTTVTNNNKLGVICPPTLCS